MYLAIGLLFYFTGWKLKFRAIQRRVFQPFMAPALFVVAGYFLGLPAPLMNRLEYSWAIAMALALLIMATVVHSIYEVLEIEASSSPINEA